MILQVHDELVFESPVDEADKLMKLVKDEMEGAVKLLSAILSRPIDLGRPA